MTAKRITVPVSTDIDKTKEQRGGLLLDAYWRGHAAWSKAFLAGRKWQGASRTIEQLDDKEQPN